MAFIYISNSRIPTAKAHGAQIMRMCEKFADFTSPVKLLTPRKKNYLKVNPFDYYGVKKNFTLEKVFSFDFGSMTTKLPKLLFFLDLIVFVIIIAFSGEIKKGDIVYARDYLSLIFLSSRKNKLIVEIHDVPNNTYLFKRTLKKADNVIVITKGLKDKIVSLGVDAGKIIIAPDAVELEDFDLDISKDEARKKISLPLDKKIILYSGQLYSWKGAEILAEVATSLGENVLVVFVGGTEPWISTFIGKYGKSSKIKIIGSQKRELIPVFLKSADVLVLPNSGKETISALYTSPLKMFEYMASVRPIVASDLPSIREILNSQNAFFFKPDDGKDLARAISYVLVNPVDGDNKAKRAYLDVSSNTWKNRAEKILKTAGLVS